MHHNQTAKKTNTKSLENGRRKLQIIYREIVIPMATNFSSETTEAGRLKKKKNQKNHV